MDEMKINYPDSEKTFLLSDKELEGCYLDCRDNYFIGICTVLGGAFIGCWYWRLTPMNVYLTSSCGGSPLDVIKQYIETTEPSVRVDALYPRPEETGFYGILDKI